MRLALSVFLCLLACQSDRPATRPLPEGEGAGSPTLESAPRRPLSVRWSVTEQDASRLSVKARFHFGPALRQPLHVTVTVPSGLMLLAGDAEFELTPPEKPGLIEREYQFAVETVPSEALVIEASVQSESAGLHARDEFTFSEFAKAPPLPEQAPREQAPVHLQGKNLGAPRTLN